MRFTIDEKTNCWNYSGPLNEDGYGKISLNKKDFTAHRLIAHICIKPLMSTTEVVAHKCDNPTCINPEHLFITTSAGNTADRTSKGRGARGEFHPNTKLVSDDVHKIRELYSSGLSQSHIAKLFSISQSSVFNIVNRKTWSHT